MILGGDGRIVYRHWQAPFTEAVFLLVHGLGAHSGRWKFLADYFLRNNISSWAIELKGFGQTQGIKGDIGSLNIYFDDILRLYDIVKKENPSPRIFLVGESLGALISFLIAALNSDLFDGLICISPAFKSRLEFKISDYLGILLSLLSNPRKQFRLPFSPQMCTRDVAYQKIMDLEDNEHRLATSRLLFKIFIAQGRAESLKDKIRIPVLFLLAGDDKLADPNAAVKVFSGLKTEDKRLIQYPAMYHALSVDLNREKVFLDMLQWVKMRL